MILVASSLSLLAIGTGMFLYAKTLKEGLNRFFKFGSLFIIIVGFLNLFAGCAFFIAKGIYKVSTYHHNMEKGSYGHHGNKMKKYSHMKSERMHNDNYEHRMKSTCCCVGMNEMESDECCPSGMGLMKDKSYCVPGKMMVRKDSIIMKK